MAIKVLVNQIGQHIIADTRQVEKKDSGDVVAYFVKEPRVVIYNRDTETNSITVNFGSFCLVSDENEFTIKESNIVAILEPRDDVLISYKEKVFGNESGTDDLENGSTLDDTDGSDGVRTKSAPEETNDGVGEDEIVTDTVA